MSTDAALAFSRPKGFSDLGPDAARLARRIEATLLEVFARYGYEVVEVPTLEYVDLYHRERLGDALFHSLITARLSDSAEFPARGSIDAAADGSVPRAEALHDVVLRPDFTAPVARMFVSRLAAAGLPDHLPLRYAYAGPVFRELAVSPLRHREFRQVGVELVGCPPGAGDLEVLLLAIDCAEALGLPPWRLHLGHARLFRAMLMDEGLAGEALTAVGAGLEQAARLRLQASGPDADFRRYAEGYAPELRRFANRDGAVAESLDAPGSADIGQLRADMIATLEARLLAVWVRQHHLAPEVAARILGLAAVQGPPDAVLATLADRARGEVAIAALGALTHLCEELQRRRKVDLQLTPASSRGIAYYTGMSFELHCPGTGEAVTDVCGGGRYDELHRWIYERARLTRQVREQRPSPEPANLDGVLRGVGLAFGVERLAAALRADSAPRGPLVFVGVLENSRLPDAFDLADALRRLGVPAVAELLGPDRGQGAREQLGQAHHARARYALLIGGREWERNEVVLRDLDKAEQSALRPADALATLAEWMRQGAPRFTKSQP